MDQGSLLFIVMKWWQLIINKGLAFILTLWTASNAS
jgi:hypothetical protein